MRKPILPRSESHEPSLPVNRRPKIWATPEQWGTHRDKLTRLYWHEEKILADVMETMERENDFFATRRMYLSRFKSWGLFKHLKSAESDAIINEMFERSQDPVQTKVLVRGKELDFGRRLQGWRGPRTHLDGHVSVPFQLVIPHFTLADGGVPEAGFGHAREFVLCEAATNRDRFWVRHRDHYDWYRAWYDGCTMIFDSSYRDTKGGARILNLAFALIKPALQQRDAQFLVFYLRGLCRVSLKYPDSAEICGMLSRYTSGMSKAVLGESHPLTRLLDFFAANQTGFGGRSTMLASDALAKAYVSELETVEEFPQSLLTWVKGNRLRLAHRIGVYSETGMGLGSLLDSLQNMLETRSKIPGNGSERDAIMITVEMAYYLSRSTGYGQRAEAVSLIHNTLQSPLAQHPDQILGRIDLLYTGIDAARNIALWEQAKIWQKELVAVTKRRHGVTSPEYFDVLCHTKKLLLAEGDEAEIEKLDVVIKQVLAARETALGVEPLSGVLDPH